MYRYEDQKEMRMAMNGKMIVMLAGVFLILTAVTRDVYKRQAFPLFPAIFEERGFG